MITSYTLNDLLTKAGCCVVDQGKAAQAGEEVVVSAVLWLAVA